MEFKREHRVHYWIRLLLLAYCTIVLCYLLGSELAEGAITTKTIEDYGSHHWNSAEMQYMTVLTNGTWAYLYLNDTGSPPELWISFSEDNGTTWEGHELIDTAWGHTVIGPLGIHGGYNNSTIIVFIGHGKAGYTYEYYVGHLWDDGDLVMDDINLLFGSNTENWPQGRTSANYSHVLCTYLRSTNSHIMYVTWDFINLTKSGPTSWLGASTANAYPMPTANANGYFWIAYRIWDGSYYDFYFRDLDKTDVQILQNAWQVSDARPSAFQAFDGGYMGFVYMYEWTGTYYVRYTYLSPGVAPVSGRLIKQTANVLQNSWASMSMVDTNYTYIFVYDKTDDEILCNHGLYNAAEGTFQANAFDAWTGGASGDIGYLKSWTQQFPRYPDGNRTSTTDTGWILPWIHRIESGATDPCHFKVTFECTMHYYDWTPPAPPEPPGNGGEEDTEREWRFFSPACIAAIVVFLIVFAVLGIYMEKAF